MQHILAPLTLLLVVILVIVRVSLLRKNGIDPVHFGKLDKSDFLIPPFVLFYFYQIFARTYDLPGVNQQLIFESELFSWLGIIFCFLGVGLFLYSTVSFGSSFRVGIDIDNPDTLVTKGVFSFTRNPLYVAFWIVLLGQFLVFPSWILLLYLGGATWLFHRQVLLEEAFLTEHYGQEYLDYCAKVRRYF